MFADPSFRRDFRRDWESTQRPRLPSRSGRHVDRLVARYRVRKANRSTSWPRPPASEPLEYFMDLLAEHDSAIRWKTVVTNDRAEQRQFIFAHDTTLPGFNDSGAHARNMAFQDGGLQMLQQVLLEPATDADRKGHSQADRPIGRMAGPRRRLAAPGDRADVVVIDPAKAAHRPGPADRAVRRSAARRDADGEALRRRGAASPGRRPRGVREREVRPRIRPRTLWTLLRSQR